MPVVLQQGTPPAHPWVPLAGSIGEYFDYLGRFRFHFPPRGKILLRAALRGSFAAAVPLILRAIGDIALLLALASFHSGLITRMP
jgi:hypothetical protein